ncbi:uncharacterized protein LOC116611620 [Nematostella vectensis]|uniref:uncharacterized protein LOC116611620 n=1 Tax=Nematostella vectensis TaxID=45351 RepID=UPI00139069D1|nr:uncharacterized protein LOC116611620 [Nematostella vectensis]
MYAVQCNTDEFDEEGRKKAKDANWFDKEGNIKPLTVEELKAFLGITIMMGIVDLSDQHRSYYTVSSRRHVKWWKYLFYFYMDISIINALQLHGQSAEAKLTNFEFRLALAKSLIGTYEGRQRAGRPRVLPVIADVEHFSEKLADKAKACKNCQSKNKRLKAGNQAVKRAKETRNGCRKCDVHLCVGGVNGTSSAETTTNKLKYGHSPA